MTHAEATFCTVTDAVYFLGTVALLNSLRLTGHEGELVVLDCGLRLEQRHALAARARVVPMPADHVGKPEYAKAAAALAASTDVLLVLDSDIIVTGSLGGLIAEASSGRVCAFPDRRASRRFAEWEALLRLATSPRAGETYVNTGVVALSTRSWPSLLGRWHEANARAAVYELARRSPRLPLDVDPLGNSDQDVLNALLMSELPVGATLVLDQEAAPQSHLAPFVSVVDEHALSCRCRDRETLLVHVTAMPKPWEPAGWRATAYPAFRQLLPRVLCGDDVVLRLRPATVPPWLRPGLRGRTVRALSGAAANLAGAAVHALPAPLRARVLRSIRSAPYRRRARDRATGARTGQSD